MRDSPLRQGAGTGSRLTFGGYIGLRRWNSRSRLFFRGLGIYRRGWRREQVRGPTGSPRGKGACPTLVGPTGLPSGNFLLQYFYIFQKKSMLIFSAFREHFYFCIKNNTTVVLLKTVSVRVSSIQIMQIRVQNKGKSLWKSRYVGDVS